MKLKERLEATGVVMAAIIVRFGVGVISYGGMESLTNVQAPYKGAEPLFSDIFPIQGQSGLQTFRCSIKLPRLSLQARSFPGVFDEDRFR